MTKSFAVQQPLPTKPQATSALLSDDDEKPTRCSPAVRVGSTPLSPSFGSAVLAPQPCCADTPRCGDTKSPRRAAGAMEKISLDDDIEPSESSPLIWFFFLFH